MLNNRSFVAFASISALVLFSFTAIRPITAFPQPLSQDSSLQPELPGPTLADPGYTPGWLIETIETGGVGNGSSIALDSLGRPHIAYFDFTNNRLKFASRGVSGWTVETVDSGGFVGRFPSLALDGSDNPHISYCQCTTSSCLRCKDLKYAYYDGSWHTQLADPSDDDTGGYTSLALLNGKPHITYYNYSTGNLEYTYKDSSNNPHWQTIHNSDADVGRFSTLKLGSSYRFVSYYDDSYQDVKYAVYDGSSWTISTPDSSPYTGKHASMDLCRNYSPELANIAYVSSGDLRIASKSLYSGWGVAVYDHDSPVGISVAVGEFCWPRVSYFNQITGDLYFLTWDSYGIRKQIIDDDGDPWDNISSLALDSQFHPHISYYDNKEDYSLRYAYKGWATFLPIISK